MTYEFPQALLIQFAKAPEPGKVKTRMQPQLTAEQSLSLHCRLVKRTYQTLVHSAVATVELWTSGGDRCQFFRDLEPRAILREQRGADLGVRMHHALADGLDRYEAVVLVGSDCPFLSPEVLSEALGLLVADKDCVLGPATDGGYVLIGLTRNSVELFADIDWGTDQVLAQTRSRLRQLGWQWAELTPLSDIDKPEDLSLVAGLKEYDV